MLAATIGLGAFSAGADMQLTSKTPPSFDKSAFEQSAHQALKDKVMGYSFLIMEDGKLVTEGAGGNARNKADGIKAMTTSTPQNLGSLFKFISGVSMLHILERPPAGSAGGQGSFASASMRRSRCSIRRSGRAPSRRPRSGPSPSVSCCSTSRIPRLQRSDGLLRRIVRRQPDRQARL